MSPWPRTSSSWGRPCRNGERDFSNATHQLNSTRNAKAPNFISPKARVEFTLTKKQRKSTLWDFMRIFRVNADFKAFLHFWWTSKSLFFNSWNIFSLLSGIYFEKVDFTLKIYHYSILFVFYAVLPLFGWIGEYVHIHIGWFVQDLKCHKKY